MASESRPDEYEDYPWSRDCAILEDLGHELSEVAHMRVL